MQELEKEAMVIGCKQEQQQVKVLALEKYCALDIETKVQEVQKEEALWTDFVFEEKGKEVESKTLGTEHNKEIASKIKEIKKEASMSP